MHKILYFLAAILLTSCSKDDSSCEDNQFIFGDAFGFCAGDCANLYKIRGDLMFADNIDNYYSGNISFQRIPLPENKYQAARHLPDQLPAYLAKGAGGSLGCPDCMDQGLIHIEFIRNNEKIRCKLDRHVDALPPEVQDYAREVLRVLDEIR